SQLIASLSPGADTVIVTEYVITQADLDAGKVDNTASAAFGNDVLIADETVTATQNFEFSITKVATPQTYSTVGEVISYDITVTNDGNVTLEGISVTDPLTDLSQLIASLSPGADTVIVTEYVITQADLDAGKVDNTASAAFGNDVLTADETVTAIQNFEFSITKVATPQTYSTVGEVISYDITVTNDGNVTLEGISVTDPLTDLSQLIASLSPGADTVIVTEYVITQADLDAGKVDNTASAAFGNDVLTADETVTATQNFEFSITKVATPQTYSTVGEVISYDITVTNDGNVTLEGILVTDPLTDLSQLIASLSPGADTVIVTEYVITQADLDAGKVDNTA
ncbi:DUF7507 domain-containing protein, partial [Belliella aquatica]|uniref:DUF7507 domain-containing protein n=1 Tax=Belliella aquatica TaxID=1323734 RepID=UPI001E636923